MLDSHFCYSPGLVSFGSPLGLQDIEGEASTYDGYVLNPLVDKVPEVAGGADAIIRAVDGLQYAGRDALYASSSSPFSKF